MVKSGLVMLSILAACGKGGDSKGAPAQGSAANPTPAAGGAGATYFEFTVDGGAPIKIPSDTVTTSWHPDDKYPEFKIFGGESPTPHVMLVINQQMKGPSSTPNGSPVSEEGISQGSVFLQDYPEKGIGSISFSNTYPERSVVVPDAVVVTAVEADGKNAAFVTGTFKAKTFGEKDHETDPKLGNHEVVGKFRVRKEFASSADAF